MTRETTLHSARLDQPASAGKTELREIDREDVTGSMWLGVQSNGEFLEGLHNPVTAVWVPLQTISHKHYSYSSSQAYTRCSLGL